MQKNKIYLGDSLEILKTFPDESIDMCVTSPPYFRLRDYGIDGQMGLEETPEEYINNLVNVFSEVKRVLKKDGTLWVNIGDSYAGHNSVASNNGRCGMGTKREKVDNRIPNGCKNKDLIGIPWMLAFALRADGWHLRQDIIWCLSGGTYLYVKSTKGVMPMLIKDMIRLDYKTIQLWNGEKWVNVNGWKKSNFIGEKLELILRSGERIQCTSGHKWILEDGTEKYAIELKKGDVLKTTTLPNESCHNPQILTKDVLWLIGLYLAEGSKSKNTIQLSLNADEIKWFNRIENTITYLGGSASYTIFGNRLGVRIYSKIFHAILNQYIGGKVAKNKHLNTICWSMPNDNLKEIMNGYLDGDGCFCKKENRWRLQFTRNYSLERDLRILASRLGASLTLKLSFAKIKNKKFKSFQGEWRWNESTHFNSKKRSEIVDIKKGSGRTYYDISVDCENHLFSLASGVLTHNCKPNSIPESVTDRCTKSHEYIFLLSKSDKYYFDFEAIQEEATGYDGRKDTKMHGSTKYKDANIMPDQKPNSLSVRGHERWTFKNGKAIRRKRDVWTVPTKPCKEAHFATFPIKLIEPCILSGCPENGIVLDPFMGSGSTAIAARLLGRNYVGCELNQKYIAIAEKRLVEEVGLFK